MTRCKNVRRGSFTRPPIASLPRYVRSVPEPDFAGLHSDDLSARGASTASTSLEGCQKQACRTRLSFQLPRDKFLDHLDRLIGLRTRLRDPFVNGVFEQAIVTVAAGGPVGLDEFLHGNTLSSSAPCIMRNGTRLTFSSRSRISCGLPSWIVSQGLKNTLLF